MYRLHKLSKEKGIERVKIVSLKALGTFAAFKRFSKSSHRATGLLCLSLFLSFSVFPYHSHVHEIVTSKVRDSNPSVGCKIEWSSRMCQTTAHKTMG